MKKTLIVLASLALSSSVFAAGSNPNALNSGANPVTTTACPLLSAAVTATLSAGNIGNVDCNDSTANIGVALSNTSGKFKTFSLSSNGGALAVKTGDRKSVV